MPIYSIDGVVPVVDPTAFVHPTAVLIGDVIVGPGCYVGPCVSMRGDFGRIIMQQGANLQDSCVMHGFPGTDTLIEEDGHIGHGAVLHGCVIRRNGMVGMNAVVMDGAIVGPSAIVAASAFVKAGMEIPERSLAAGVPAKIIRQLSDEEARWKIEGTKEYQRLVVRSLNTMQECAPLSKAEPDRKRVYASGTKPLYQSKEG